MDGTTVGVGIPVMDTITGVGIPGAAIPGTIRGVTMAGDGIMDGITRIGVGTGLLTGTIIMITMDQAITAIVNQSAGHDQV